MFSILLVRILFILLQDFMKKILTLLLLTILTFSTTFAYTQNELTAKTNAYKTVIKQKIGGKLAKISETKLRKILLLVDKLVLKYKNKKNITDKKRLQKIAILMALKDIVNERLDDEFDDINSILNTVGKNYGPIFIVSDKRCGAKCDTTELIKQLRQIWGLKDANIVELDFSTTQAKNLLKTSSITKLPAAIFPDNKVEGLNKYLQPTTSKSYFLELGSTFNPYLKLSAKGFKILDKNNLSIIIQNSYIKGNTNARILWLEYSDMECPFCAKLHNSWTPKDLEKKYWTKLAYSLQHFPLWFHKNALPAAQYLECVGKLKWKNAFYSLEEKLFAANKSDEEFIITTAVWELWVDNAKLVKCVEDNEFLAKIKAQQTRWTKLFWVTGTPWNVLINTITWEYSVISGAYPTSSFVEVIDKLLK